MANPEQPPQPGPGKTGTLPKEIAQSAPAKGAVGVDVSKPATAGEQAAPPASPPATTAPSPNALVTPENSITGGVPKRRYLTNLGLIVLLVISATIWFLRHMEHLFAGALVGGSLLTVWMVVQLAYATIKWGAEEEMKTLPRLLLGSSWSSMVLSLLFGVSIALNVFTSSLYVEYSGAGPEVEKCTVDVLDAATSRRFIDPPMKVNSVYKIAGERFFFRLRRADLKFNLIEPRGYEPRLEKLGVGTAILLRVPADFRAKEFHILRIVFAPVLWNRLAEPDDAPPVLHDLQITIGAESTLIRDVRRQTIYAGAASEDIDHVLKHEDSTQRKNDFNGHLSALGFPAERRQDLIDAWESRSRIAATDEHSPGEPITLALRQRGNDIPIAREESKRITPSMIQTIVLEK